MKLTLLGTGTPRPSAQRQCTANLLLQCCYLAEAKAAPPKNTSCGAKTGKVHGNAR